MKQHEAVILALERLGGQATLAALYTEAMKIPDCKWGTRTPFASIRRIVQTRPKEIFKVRPGLWALESHRERLGVRAGSGKLPVRQASTEDHSYYQGLVLELGKFRGYGTYCPNQDKNRPFVGGTLGAIRTLKELPAFTYKKIVRRASTIDVTWINERGFPHSFFEVEFTPDFQRSLIKYVDLQDFYTKMVIVASASSRQEYDNKKGAEAFRNIRNRIGFLTYEDLAKYHEHAAFQAASEFVP